MVSDTIWLAGKVTTKLHAGSHNLRDRETVGDNDLEVCWAPWPRVCFS